LLLSGGQPLNSSVGQHEMFVEMSHPNRITETVLKLALWCGVAILVAIAVATVIGRAWSLAHSGFAYDQFRQMLPATEAHFVDEFNQWFTTHPILTCLHIVPGGLLVVLAPFQFSSHIRSRWIRFHRWSGRVIALAALPVGLSGLVLGAVFPFGGPLASSAVFAAGALFLAAVVQAFIAIRRRDVVRHREWMLRMFSIGIGISSVRLVGLVLLLIIPTSPLELRTGLSFWIGFALTFVAAEFWVRHTRPPGLTEQLRTNAAQLVGRERR
jgi:hypothetical protein